MADEIIRELWKIKDDMARKYNYDLDALIAHLRERGKSRTALPGKSKRTLRNKNLIKSKTP